MLEKIKNIIFSSKEDSHTNKNILSNLVEKTKINILKRSKNIDFDLLGRSLSCNPFPPRFFYSDLEIKDNKLYVTQIKSESHLESINSQLKAIIIDTTLSDDISLVATSRRYTPYLIIHKDIIISKYQVLESAVYGADMIILDGDILDANSLAILFEFASNLGLGSVLSLSDKENLRDYFDFFILKNQKLLPIIEKNKTIIYEIKDSTTLKN